MAAHGPSPRAKPAVARIPDKRHPLLVTVPGAALCAARLPATACTPPADGTAQPNISQPPASSAGGSGSPPALPEPGIPGSNPGPQAGEPQRHGHGSSAAGQPGTFYPERAASVINLPGETHPARRTTSGYASADIPRKIPESAMVPHRFGCEPVACRLAAGQPSSTTTASPAWAKTNTGESASKVSSTCRQETMSFVRKWRNASATRTSA
jgi:hypothetical protein